jgi:hypothetical protein
MMQIRHTGVVIPGPVVIPASPVVIPAKAGTQGPRPGRAVLGSRFRGNDGWWREPLRQ